MKSAIIFGYNEFALEIAHSLKTKYNDLSLFVLEDKDFKFLQENNFKVSKFSIDDDWSDLENEYDIDELIVFCALEDTAENIFLTISLRAVYENLIIIALSSDQESGRKLKMAGANKIIPITQTTVNIITEMLERPFVTEILNNILYSDDELQIAQVTIEQDSEVIGQNIESIDWKNRYGLLVLAIIRENLDTSFIYTKKANKEPLKEDDVLVIVGYENDIKEFEKTIGRRYNANWRNWSW
ncbi:TrkA C-terminal domain-containing protein [Sulfurimonas sp. HSL-1716]|uniref:TrkA C-terminal domain-containing protein n=1 Tax=Hydrocurvibacter sulfurireducens TaxID=3131937 RepID=UPI0031F781C5